MFADFVDGNTYQMLEVNGCSSCSAATDEALLDAVYESMSDGAPVLISSLVYCPFPKTLITYYQAR